jgi:uncharacterized protein (TIGR01777 family)
MNPANCIILAGGSGFVGTAASRELIRRGHEVVVLTRSPQPRTDGVREVAWDGKNPGEWVQLLDGAEAIVNLTGKNINCPHTPENLHQITASRVDSVKAIAQAMAQLKTPPRTWIQASATGFYGDTGDHLCAENSPNGQDALAKVCQEWEAAFTGSPCPKTRKVTLRLGVVLGREGGAFPILSGLTKAFLGGAVGSGRQYISWIHLADLIQIFMAALEREDLQGTFNAVAPDPVMNAEFMRELRGALHRPWSPPVPKFAVKLGAWVTRSDPSLSLTSQRCAPQRLLKAGFTFKFSHLRPALDDLCA